ncbi:MAG: alpha/beta hydrolase, partial [Anaerolineae bacterium]|nr:alpha/beta hydrolase [Anaerolineae bacterium]
MPEPQIFKINEQRMAVLAFNETLPGTPIIFIHGIMSSINFWTSAENEFLNQRPWYALSLPGHYPASFPGGFHHSGLTAELIAQTVSSAVQHLVGDTPVMLIGHSTGGFAALATAAYAPDRVCGVVSISGFAQGKWTGALGILQRLTKMSQPGKALFRQNLKLMASSDQLYKAAFRVYAADREALYTDPALAVTAAVLYQDFQQLSTEAMFAYFRHMPDIDITAWLPKITA